MISRITVFSVLFILCVLQISCSKDEPAPTSVSAVLSNEYEGFLKLRFTNTFPAFDETTQVEVHINKAGEMTFGTGTLAYDGDDDNGQSRIRRVGTLTLNPNGHHFDNNDEDYVDVKENTTVNETMTVWYWDPNSQTWIQTINENINDLWNGGLAFSIDDAVLTGSVVQSVTANGSVIWTLNLVVVP
jgi:hypothetical protein